MSEEVKNENTEVVEVNEEAEVNENTSETTEKSNEQKTFTQAELDEIVAKRLERERKKYADFNELKEKATKYEQEAEQRRLAEMSEKEKAEELARKYEEEKEQLAKQLEDYQAQVRNEKIRNKFITLAQAANIQYVEDAIKLADLSGVTVNEDNEVVGMDEVVNSLIENKPFLVVQKQRKSVGDPTNGDDGKAAEKTKEQLLKEAAEQAKKSGRPEDFAKFAQLKRELR